MSRDLRRSEGGGGRELSGKGGLVRRVVFASGLLVMVVGAAFAIVFVAMSDLRDASRSARKSEQILGAANKLERLVVDLETGVRGFVITGEERFLAPYDDARAGFEARAAAVEGLVARNGEQADRLRRIRRAVTSYVEDYAAPLIDRVRRGDAGARSVSTTAEGKRRIDKVRSDFDRFVASEQRRARASEDHSESAWRRAIAIAAGALAACLLFVLVFSGYVTRAIVRPVRRAAGMADQLAGGDLSTRMPEDDIGEIGTLERSFNSMAGSLESSRDELRRLLDQQSALRRVATLVAEGVSPSRVFEVVTREVGLLSGADFARMERYETDGSVTGIAVWGRDVGARLAVNTRFALEGVSIAAMVREEHGPVRVESFAEASGPIAEEARELGIRSSVGCPIIVEGQLWGVIAASTTGTAPFPDETEARIGEFTELVATAVANAESRDELAASRARIVAAADESRRRIERDLHDGAQQRLVALALTLRSAVSVIPTELRDVRAELDAVGSGLDGVLEDLRVISRGIHPAILSEGGLGPALRTLARRSSVSVVMNVGVERRLPEGIEVAAYYVVSEALTNAAKHAEASAIEVDVDTRDGLLRLSIRDDGVGGADPSRGSGLIGLKDRVEAVGGTIVVESPAGAGTALRVDLPVDEAWAAPSGAPTG